MKLHTAKTKRHSAKANQRICFSFVVPGAPKILKQQNDSLSDSVNITWEKPDNPHGVILAYNLYWKTEDEEMILSGKATVDGQQNQYPLPNLSKLQPSFY